jgi:hypothetical protein
MSRPLWQLLLADPADLTCDECFALMEYYAEILMRGGTALIPKVLEHLKRCPHCEVQHREALKRLVGRHPQSRTVSTFGVVQADGSDAKDQR